MNKTKTYDNPTQIDGGETLFSLVVDLVDVNDADVEESVVVEEERRVVSKQIG
jgi:hypothetical protein